MINQYLFDAWVEYQEKGTYQTLIDFANKTFPKNGTDKLFIGCALILISSVINKNYATVDSLLSILECGKEKIDDTNLLRYYYERINPNKDVSRNLKKVIYSEHFDDNLDMLIDYYERWCFDMKSIVKKHYEEKMKKN